MYRSGSNFQRGKIEPFTVSKACILFSFSNMSSINLPCPSKILERQTCIMGSPIVGFTGTTVVSPLSLSRSTSTLSDASDTPIMKQKTKETLKKDIEFIMNEIEALMAREPDHTDTDKLLTQLCIKLNMRLQKLEALMNECKIE